MALYDSTGQYMTVYDSTGQYMKVYDRTLNGLLLCWLTCWATILLWTATLGISSPMACLESESFSKHSSSLSWKKRNHQTDFHRTGFNLVTHYMVQNWQFGFTYICPCPVLGKEAKVFWCRGSHEREKQKVFFRHTIQKRDNPLSKVGVTRQAISSL